MVIEYVVHDVRNVAHICVVLGHNSITFFRAINFIGEIRYSLYDDAFALQINAIAAASVSAIVMPLT